MTGSKTPWFNKKECKYIGNISYMSVLANALVNVMGSIDNKAIRYAAKNIAKPISFYFKIRLKNKMYKSMPEIPIIRYLKHKIFDPKRDK
jgi:hypothetical protein